MDTQTFMWSWNKLYGTEQPIHVMPGIRESARTAGHIRDKLPSR